MNLLRAVPVLALVAATAALGPALAGATAGDPERGARVYERCQGCHSLDANQVGPAHRGVYGRRAGGVGDFRYSVALSASGIVWDDATLDRWLADPGGFVPGSRMGYRLRAAQDRVDVIAFLKRAGQAP